MLPFHFDTLGLTPHYFIMISCHICEFFGSPPGSKQIFCIKWSKFILPFSYIAVYIYVYTKVAFPPCEIREELFELVARCGIPKNSLNELDQTHCEICKACDWFDNWICLNKYKRKQNMSLWFTFVIAVIVVFAIILPFHKKSIRLYFEVKYLKQ